ncbi:hypothetical protein ACJVW2_09200 [Staphylococcus coagulans]
MLLANDAEFDSLTDVDSLVESDSLLASDVESDSLTDVDALVEVDSLAN